MNQVIPMPKAIAMGARLRLRKEAFKNMKARDWQFSGVEEGKLVLWRPEGLVLKADREDIDWEVHNKPKIED